MKQFLSKNPIFTGTLLLTAAGILSRIVGFFYRIFLSRTIGAEGLGIYQLIFPVMGICFSLTSAGIQTSISRYVSMETANHNLAGAKLYLSIGLIISTVLSLLTGFFLWTHADDLALHMLGESRCAPLLKIIAFSYVPCCIHACINGYFYGLKKAAVPSVSQLVEQLVRVGSVYLIYRIVQSNGGEITIAMAAWGITLGEIGGMLVSLSCIGPGNASGNIAHSTKLLLKMAVPLTANRIVLNLFSSFENIMIPSRLKLFGYTTAEALSVFGILSGMAISVIMFPAVITNSVSVMLLPMISEAQAQKNQYLIKRALTRTVEICLLLGFLSTLAFLLLGDFIGNFLFQNSLAGTFITTLSWICPFLYLSSTLTSILHGLGYPELTFLLSLGSCGIRILFVLFAIPIIGIRGYLYGLLASHILTTLLSLWILYQKTKKSLEH